MIGPEPDQACEALHDDGDNSVVSERALSVFARGEPLGLRPGEELAQPRPEAWLHLTPALDCA